MSERRVCRVLGQHRSTQRKQPRGAEDEEALTEDIIALAKQYGRYGYRRVTALLHVAGWSVNHKRVERIWRREGLKVPQRQPKRGRLWLNDGSCIRLRPEYPGHVWAYDFVEGRTHDGRKFRILTIIDEASRECLALIVTRQLNHEDVLAALAELFIEELRARVLNFVGKFVVLEASDFVFFELAIQDCLLSGRHLGGSLFLFGADEKGSGKPVSEGGHKSGVTGDRTSASGNRCKSRRSRRRKGWCRK